MSTSLYNQVQKFREKYDEASLRRSILIIRNVENRTTAKHRMLILRMVAPVIIKNVNNFFNLIKNVDKSLVIHEKDDIVAECYLVLDKCLEKYDLSYKESKFYFYLNKALAAGLYRIQERCYHNRVENVDVHEISKWSDKINHQKPSHPLFLSSVFTEQEVVLMKSKMEEQKIQDFCDENKISKKEHGEILRSVKGKIKSGYLC